MKIAMLMGLILVLGASSSCAGDECTTSEDCTEFGEACVDSGGLLFGGKSCVNLSVRVTPEQDQDLAAQTDADLDQSTPDMQPDFVDTAPDMADLQDMELDSDMPVTEPIDPSAFLTCADNPQPARCTEDAQTFEWGSASYVTHFELIDDNSCCFDFDGDSNLDNGLQEIAFVVNESINVAIDQGTWVMGFEHDGLETGATAYRLNVWQSRLARNQATRPPNIEIAQAALDEGTHPLSYFPIVHVNGTHLTAEGGAFDLLLLLDEVELKVRAESARLDGELLNESESESGVDAKLKIGGLVSAESVAEAFSEYVATDCACLGLEGPWVTWNQQSSIYVCEGSETNSCDSDSSCNNLPPCPLFNTVFKPDIDQLVDGREAHFSFGLLLDLSGARIVGVE